ncbi:MAG: TIGR03032 family protein [Actinomycetota bacterium]|nr:TIGR03032 family protein [Actinomycetota bacterium]
MRLDVKFIRLALRVDAARLAAEVASLPDEAWVGHPEGAPGNTAVPLVAAAGDPADHATIAAMAPTPALATMPYTRAVMAALGAPIGRTRLMRIEREGQLGHHVDTNRYWQDHFRIHVPVLTHPSVRFDTSGDTVHMAAGEVWVFDTWESHGVVNPADHPRIHLVIDSVGSSHLWRLVDRGRLAGIDGPGDGDMVSGVGEPVFEAAAPLAITPPWQQRVMADGLLRDLGDDLPSATALAVRNFLADWHALWAAYGDADEARPNYAALVRRLDTRLDQLPPSRLPNGSTMAEAVRQLLLRPALTPPSIAPPSITSPSVAAETTDRAGRKPARRLDRPVFLVSSPRSGSTLLFETLARAKGVFTIGGESHEVFESIRELHPASRGWHSNALAAADATLGAVRLLEDSFIVRSHDREGRPPAGYAPIRLLEKTPKNALRVPFLAEAFPDAVFVYLHRDAQATVSSMLEAWRSGRFVTYPRLPGWGDTAWSLLLVPGWREMIGLPLVEVAARQWATTTSTLLDDLQQLDPQRWCVVGHEQLLADPDGEAGRLCARLGFEWDRPLPGPLPPSRSTLDAPEPDKWMRNADELATVQSIIEPVARRVAALVADPPAGPQLQPGVARRPGRPVGVPVPPASAAAPSPAADGSGGSSTGSTGASDSAASARVAEEVFGSVHTPSFAELLRRSGSSVIVTTYQSGRVVLLRSGADGALNTHLRAFARPMGVAVAGNRLALGTDQAVWRFDNQPALAARLGEDEHDVCYVPRSSHVTGDISVHEMAWAGDELWVVNTRFSCLATLDPSVSFVPRWRPSFVTALAAEDRCHLNGMAMVDGRPRFVTAMGMSDEHQGWRRDKVGGGVVIDVDSGGIVAHGLTMPHSPRWHGGRLWVLDSGQGTLCTVDLVTGDAHPVVRLPGFTRGLAFLGRYALVGLSKVREHVFAGLPLAQHIDERCCGVWLVDTESGAIAGFMRFEGAVEEVFDVQVLPGARYPELLEPGDSLAAAAFVLPAGTDAASAVEAPSAPADPLAVDFGGRGGG